MIWIFRSRPRMLSSEMKFSFVRRLEVQLKTPEPAGRLQPVVPVRFVRKRKPPVARAANSLLAVLRNVSADAVADPSLQTNVPEKPLFDANLPIAVEWSLSAVTLYPIATAARPVMLNESGSHLPLINRTARTCVVADRHTVRIANAISGTGREAGRTLTWLPLPNTTLDVLSAKLVSPKASAYSPLAVELLPPDHEKKPTLASSHS